jgi:hypothetical protein
MARMFAFGNTLAMEEVGNEAFKESKNMLWTIFVILLVMWL